MRVELLHVGGVNWDADRTPEPALQLALIRPTLPVSPEKRALLPNHEDN